MPPVVSRSTSSTATPTPAKAGGKAPLADPGDQQHQADHRDGQADHDRHRCWAGQQLIWPKGIDKRNPPIRPARTNFQSLAERGLAGSAGLKLAGSGDGSTPAVGSRVTTG